MFLVNKVDVVSRLSSELGSSIDLAGFKRACSRLNVTHEGSGAATAFDELLEQCDKQQSVAFDEFVAWVARWQFNREDECVAAAASSHTTPVSSTIDGGGTTTEEEEEEEEGEEEEEDRDEEEEAVTGGGDGGDSYDDDDDDDDDEDEPSAPEAVAVVSPPKQRDIQRVRPVSKAETILHRVYEKILTTPNAMSVFRKFDRDKSGTLDPQEIQDGMQDLKMNISKSEAELVVKLLAKSGAIPIDDLINKVFARHILNVQKRMRIAIKRHNEGLIQFDRLNSNLPELVVSMEVFDLKAFVGILANAKMTDITDKEARDVFEFIDSERTGNVNFCDFKAFVMQEEANLLNACVVENALQYIFTQLTNSGLGPLETFRRWDKTSRGVLSKAEFENGLKQSSLKLGKSETKMLIAAIDVQGTGTIAIEAFLERIKQLRRRKVNKNASPKQMQKAMDLRTTGSRFKPAADGKSARKASTSSLAFSATSTQSRVITKEGSEAVGSGIADGVYRRFIISHSDTEALGKAFRRADLDSSGSLDLQEFMRAMKELNMVMSTKQAQAVISKYGTEGKHSVNIEKFLHSVFLARVDTLREQLVTTASTQFQEGSVGFEKLFRRYDRDSSGIIEYSEFLQAVRKDAKVPPSIPTTSRDSQKPVLAISDSEVRRVFEYVDFGGKGCVLMDQFTAFLAATPTILRKLGSSTFITTRTMNYIHDHLQEIGSSPLDAFRRWDKNGSGELDAGVFKAAMESIGLEMQKHELDQVFRDLDTTGDAQISVEELLAQLRTVKRTRAKAGTTRTGTHFSGRRGYGSGIDTRSMSPKQKCQVLSQWLETHSICPPANSTKLAQRLGESTGLQTVAQIKALGPVAFEHFVRKTALTTQQAASLKEALHPKIKLTDYSATVNSSTSSKSKEQVVSTASPKKIGVRSDAMQFLTPDMVAIVREQVNTAVAMVREQYAGAEREQSEVVVKLTVQIEKLKAELEAEREQSAKSQVEIKTLKHALKKAIPDTRRRQQEKTKMLSEATDRTKGLLKEKQRWRLIQSQLDSKIQPSPRVPYVKL